MYMPSLPTPLRRPSTQSHLRAGIGLSILIVTLGTQLIWWLAA